MESIYLAIDIGASSGRHIIIRKQDDIFLDEIYRFEHNFYERSGHFFWSQSELLEHVKTGIRLAIKKYPKLKSIGIDTWGVDYTYIDKNGEILRDPISYRDDRGKLVTDDLYEIINKDDLYRKTGIQYLQFNTIFQMYHDTKYFKEDIKKAHKMLMIPDLIGYHLTQSMALEYTNFSTTNMMDLKTKKVIDDIESLGISKKMFPQVVKPGHLLGYLNIFKPEDLKHKKIKVFNVCSHDTASAFASIKKEKGVAVINTGTWSLLGSIIDQAVTSEKAKNNNFTNEAGIQGIRFLKNIMGMWIINRCKKHWELEGDMLTFKTLEKKALLAKPYKCLIDPDADVFNQKDNMPLTIQTYCRDTNQEIPESIGEIARCVYESLALKYKYVIEKLEDTLGYQMDKILIIGGGTQSKIHNEFTTKITQKDVYVGPIEATVLGNSIVQMLANGDIESLEEGQDLIYNHLIKIEKKEFDIDDYNAYEKFKKLVHKEHE